jgi:Fe-S cluster assembly protein SufD
MNQTAVDRFLKQASADTVGMPWLNTLRSDAALALRQVGFPTRRIEEWKYTDVRALLEQDFTFQTSAAAIADDAIIESAKTAGLDCHELVFINGKFSREHSTLVGVPDGIIIQTLSEAMGDGESRLKDKLNKHLDIAKNGFIALNSAFLQEGSVVLVPDNTQLEKPLNLVFVTVGAANSASNLRNLIVIGQNAKASIIETYFGEGETDTFTNTLTEIHLNDGANLQHYRLQQEGNGTYHVGYQHVNQARDSRFESYAISLGGCLARTDLDVSLAGSGASCLLNGLYLAHNKQHIDNHTRVDHLVPHTACTENYRGVLNGQSRGVFNGKILVHKDAQKTDAHLSNLNLLLSSEAEVDTKPELEIYANDVKCSHGATVGRLDEKMMFYLRSRAIEESLARSLLTYAFAEGVVKDIPYPEVLKRIENSVVARLPDEDLIREFTS